MNDQTLRKAVEELLTQDDLSSCEAGFRVIIETSQDACEKT
jgi:hypothetical protein